MVDVSAGLRYIPAVMPNRSSTRLDANELAFRIVQDATGEEDQEPTADLGADPLATPLFFSADPPPDNRNPAAVALGRLGGLKGGKARAAKLSPEERSRIAKAAAAARWKRD